MFEKLIAEARELLNAMLGDIEDLGYAKCHKPSCDTIKELIDALEDAEKQIPRWIPVTEANPTKNKEYLVTDPEDEDVCTAEWRNDHWLESDTITHWMPLPKGAEEEE